MPVPPALTLVDPRAPERRVVRQRLHSLVVGVLVAGAGAVPYALTLAR